VRTFTLREGASDKFWNIELQGRSFTVHFGRQGTKGQTQTKSFPNAGAAQREHDKLIKQKLAKGYTETTPAAAPAAPASTPLRAALEAAIVADPDDRAAHMAYADHLQEQGDPRGEFIQVQLALEDEERSPRERKQLQAREGELLAEHRDAWLGGLAVGDFDEEDADEDSPADEVRFARGWVDRLVFRDFGGLKGRAVAQAPETRLLRELILESDDYLRGQQAGPKDPMPGRTLRASDLLTASPYLGNVRLLRLGRLVEEGEEHRYYVSSPGVPDLVARMPRLEELYLLAGGYNPARLFALPTLQHLRILQVYHLQAYHPLDILAGNPVLGNLTHLLLHPHGYATAEEAFLDLAAVRAVVRSPHLKSLRHLQVRLCTMGDAGCEEIVASGILKRLKVLDLRHGCISDAGARALGACPDLRNLELLDLQRNGLTRAGVAALKATGVRVQVESQQNAQELERSEYLNEGDFE
jgi:uncharacterized protein (TIGR02996 family)